MAREDFLLENAQSTCGRKPLACCIWRLRVWPPRISRRAAGAKTQKTIPRNGRLHEGKARNYRIHLKNSATAGRCTVCKTYIKLNSSLFEKLEFKCNLKEIKSSQVGIHLSFLGIII